MILEMARVRQQYSRESLRLHPSSLKRAVVRLRAPAAPVQAGLLRPEGLETAGDIELLTPAGQALRIEREAVLAIFFVTGFEQAEALAQGSYAGRGGGRLPGVLVRLRCRDRYSVEGILASDLLEIETGVWLTPVHADAPWQRMLVPRSALEAVQVVEVIRPVRQRRPRARRTPAVEDQIGLFGELSSPEPQ